MRCCRWPPALTRNCWLPATLLNRLISTAAPPSAGTLPNLRSAHVEKRSTGAARLCNRYWIICILTCFLGAYKSNILLWKAPMEPKVSRVTQRARSTLCAVNPPSAINGKASRRGRAGSTACPPTGRGERSTASSHKQINPSQHLFPSDLKTEQK